MLKILAVLIMLFTFWDVHATPPCGMEATESGERVASRNFEICPEDLSFQGLALLTADILQDPFFKKIALWFTSTETLDNEFTKFAAQQIAISKVVYALLSAVAILSWMFMGPLLAFKLYQYASMVKKTGKLQFANSKGDTVRFVSYFLFLVGMSLPVNTVMLGQGLAVVAGLPSIMGGNFIFSTYLHSFRQSAADIRVNQDEAFIAGQSIANSLTQAELCQDRTRRALFTLNGANFNDFYSHQNRFLAITPKDVHRTYSSCLSYSATASSGPISGTIDGLKIGKTSQFLSDCPQLSFWELGSGRQIKEQHGFDHQCATIQFKVGIDNYKTELDNRHSVSNQKMDTVLSSITESFKAERFYKRHKDAYAAEITSILDNDSLPELQRYEAMVGVINKAAESIASELSSHGLIAQGGSTSEIQFKHLTAASSLLGGTMDAGIGRRVWESLVKKGKFSTATNYYFGADSTPFKPFGIEHMIDDAREIAQLIQQYHCAMNWQKHAESRLNVTKFNKAGDIKKDMADSGIPSMECITVLDEDQRGSTDLDRYWRFIVNHPKANADIKKEGDIWVKISDFDVETQEIMSNEVAKELHKKISIKQNTLATYIASVQKGVAISASKTLEKELDNKGNDALFRARGWGGFGGVLLYLNKNQSSSSHMANSIDEVLQVSSGSTSGSGNYVMMSAFPRANSAELEKRIEELYSPLQVDNLFLLGFAGVMPHPGPQGISEDDSDAVNLENFFRMLENWMFSPLQHIKEAGGLPHNKRLTEGLKDCFYDGYSHCVSGHRHPMTAMMRFGDEMMNSMLNIMITRMVVKAINRSLTPSNMLSDSGISGDKLKAGQASGFWNSLTEKVKAGFKKLSSFIKGVLSRMLMIILAISIPAEAVLDFMTPFVNLMFVVGMVFAYLVPLTAYLYGFMLLALWYLGIAVIAFVWPLYALTKLIKIEKDYQRGFQELYESFLGPYLRPLFYSIAAVLAFSFMYIVVFMANTVFGLMYGGLGAGRGFSISSLLFEVLLYAMYLAAIFIMFRYALGIMKSFPDLMLSKLRLQRSNDEKFIDSLGFETYINASIAREMISGANKHIDKMGGGTLADYKMQKEFEEFNKMVKAAGGAENFARGLSNQGDTRTPGSEKENLGIPSSALSSETREPSQPNMQNAASNEAVQGADIPSSQNSPSEFSQTHEGDRNSGVKPSDPIKENGDTRGKESEGNPWETKP